MKLRKSMLFLALGLASPLAFAQAPAPTPAAKPAEATATKPVAKKPLTARHVTCKADETLVKGKCEAKKPG